ncbi:UDP-glucose 4-epimerase GalE [Stenotrophomonas bentonitica]|uniref:UDP-glucose 4-epimerase GalE n=1 Tax=Stenotrophomonas bentonitica TaxID=1450134 RepID=UPI00345EBB84
MRVLVTGGAGYIGSHVCVELLNAGHEVIIFDSFINSDLGVPDRISSIVGKSPLTVKADLRDRAALDDCFSTHRPDAVIHFAALKSIGESVTNPLSYYDVNVVGTIDLLGCMKRYDCNLLVFSSSATVYGQPESCPIDEQAPVSATNPYGRTKLFVEQIINDAKVADPRLFAINLRYFNPVGAHQSGLIGESPSGTPNNLVPFVAQVAAGLRPRVSVFGDDYATPDGTGVRDYIHVSDLATAHVLALEQLPQLSDLQAMNLGTGRGHSVLEVIATFADISGRPIEYQIAQRRPGDVAECWADPMLALTRLGWRARFDLEQMCKDAWRWQLGSGNGEERT